ncbi:MAG: primosomal protein N' [Planctomycetes bacterium]|nr:primosomal protein N' [Planctomycetota bacterium]
MISKLGEKPEPSPFSMPLVPPGCRRQVAEIAVNAPVSRLFHYQIPPALAGRLELGHRVAVPFGRRSSTGVCVGFPEEAQVKDLKAIQEILHPDCRFDAHLLELTRWIAEYYHASWGEVLEAALPPGIRSGNEGRRRLFILPQRSAAELLQEAQRLENKARSQSRLLRHLALHPEPQLLRPLLEELPATRESLAALKAKGWIATDMLVLPRSPRASPAAADQGTSSPGSPGGQPLGPGEKRRFELHPDQQRALEMISSALEAAPGAALPPILIHGVTGSGKTEVYLRALERALRAGGRGLVLVPEISLTPQTVKRFQDGLPDAPVAVLHSLLSDRRRAEEWQDIQSGRVRLVIGARSAVFAPIPDLRLIIVDEEHEPSYKQESSPRYHGRDVAILRAHLLKIPIVLGTATPSLESYQHARAGKYRLAEMPKRVTRHDLPAIAVVSLNQDFYRADGGGLICAQLDFQIRECLRRKEQAILFLNRRGFSTFLHCVRCGFVLRCRYCDISLTYHRCEGFTQCHYCDARYEVPRSCPECQAGSLRRAGVGTEKIEEVISRRYQGARVSRLDRDAVKNHQTLHSILEKFASGETDILVGTQMLAKGLDFPRVSLVGIISADTGLQFPDFRSAERTFQLITQVAGRAGRGERPGRVIVQTFFPDHYAIRFALKNDYRGFFEAEIEHRRALGYPPFGRLAKVLVQDEKAERGQKAAAELAGRLRAAAAGDGGGRVEVLGPALAPITRLEERHRFQILLKAPTAALLQRVLKNAGVHAGGRMSREVIVDVDPQTML